MRRLLERWKQFRESWRCARPVSPENVVWGRCAGPCDWCDELWKFHSDQFKAEQAHDGPFR